MKKIVTIFSITATLIFGTVGKTEAQKSAVRYADQQMDLMNYKHALDIYEKAYAKKPDYTIGKKIAEVQDILRDYDNSYEWWKTTVGYQDADYGDYAHYLRSAQLADKFSEASGLLAEKGVSADSVPGVPAMLTLGESRPKVKLEPAKELNSEGADFVVSKDAKGNSYFVSDRGGVYPSVMPGLRIDGRNRYFSEEKNDFSDREYFSVYRQDTTGNITEVRSNVPDTYNFSDPSYDEIRGLMFYSVTRGIKKVKKKDNIVVQPEIYYSSLNDEGELEGFTPVPFNDSIGYAVMNPFVDSETKRLYFTSNMPGGEGGYDLYYSEYDQDMSFSPPVNLGPEVNTAGDESHAFRKGDSFFFSSTGHPGIGGMDVFRADYAPDRISKVQNMGLPINSLADDFGYRETVKENGKTEIYLSSNRKGGMGLDDIYRIRDLNKQFLARVIDCDGLIIADSYAVTLTDKNKNGNIQTDRGDSGDLRAELEPESDFGIKISKHGYFSLTDENITTKGFEGDTIKREYILAKIPYRLPVYVDIVFYDLDRYVIREDAKPVLDRLGELMIKYGFLDLLVASHTDSRASDEYNITLSNHRAKAVTDYLAKYGVTPSRVRLEWFGEQGLVNDCGDGVPCPELEHQLNRRSELMLEAFSDPEKEYELPGELEGKNLCDPESLFQALQEEINEIPTVYFDFDKSMLRSAYWKDLERTAILLKRLPNLMLYIEGHTDQRGSDGYNEALSERRSKAVMDYLVKRGVEGSRMEHRWFGESRPVNDCAVVNCTEAMHQLNRRTELRVGKSFHNYTGYQIKADSL